jgi:hypothetical protein
MREYGGGGERAPQDLGASDAIFALRVIYAYSASHAARIVTVAFHVWHRTPLETA